MSKRKLSDTSLAAHKQVHPTMKANHHGKIMSAMRLLNKPSSMEQIAAKAKMEYAQIHKRMSELEREGLVAKEGKGTTKSGRSCYLYSIVRQSTMTDEECTQFWKELQSEQPSPKIIQATLL